MEGHSQIRGRWGKLEGAAASNIASQNTSCDLISIGDRQHVTVTDVESEDKEEGKEILQYS